MGSSGSSRRPLRTRSLSSPRDLNRVADRVSFVYLERCVVHREDYAITAEDAEGVRHIPSATIGTLLLGPGTRVTHEAMKILGECGAGVVWLGEQGVRYYASGRALSRASDLMEAQAVAWANQRTRLHVAREMYRLRFPEEDPAGLTRKELLGREGIRLRDCYRAQSVRTGVPWHGRQYTPGDFTAGDAPNQAITAAAQCMYGVAHAVVAALGCSPALGFVHSGHELSFVMDVADLYKTEIGIPLAFDVAAESTEEVGSRTRRAVRDAINQRGLMDRCVGDIKTLLSIGAPGSDRTRTRTGTSTGAGARTGGGAAEFGGDTDRVVLLSDGGTEVEAGRNHATEEMTW